MNNYFYHYTYNNGHCIKSNEEEFDKSLYPIMLEILNESMKPEGYILDDMVPNCKFKVKTTLAPGGFMSTIYLKSKLNIEIPLLEVAGSNKDLEPIEVLTDFAKKININSKIVGEVKIPYVVDFIMPTTNTAMLETGRFNILDWTADFARCLAWTVWKYKN